MPQTMQLTRGRQKGPSIFLTSAPPMETYGPLSVQPNTFPKPPKQSTWKLPLPVPRCPCARTSTVRTAQETGGSHLRLWLQITYQTLPGDRSGPGLEGSPTPAFRPYLVISSILGYKQKAESKREGKKHPTQQPLPFSTIIPKS